MNHIQNIEKLFSKNFMESPLLESFDGGKLVVSSGFLVACDPLITNDKDVFLTEFPKGVFQVNIHKERESNCVAYVEVLFSEKEISHWEMALCKDQNIQDLSEGEIFGYPVESGMGSVMDTDTQQFLNELEKDLFEKKGNDFMGIYQEFFHEKFFEENGAIHQFSSLRPNERFENNIIAFETGYGEGFYASYIAFDQHSQPVKLITEFIEVEV